MKRLAAKDAIFLYTDTPDTHMHIAFAGVFDPSTIPDVDPTDTTAVFELVRKMYEDRLHLFPPFRWRMVPVPMNLHHPVFIEDPDFDLDYHIRRAALPAPGGKAELETFVADVISRKLDFEHPPWEAWIVEGLEDGLWAFIAKTHHVIVDGVGGNEALVNLLDLSPEIREVDPPETEWTPEEVPSDLRMLGTAATGLLSNPLRFLPAMRETAGATVDALGKLIDPRRDQPRWKVIGPRTVLNGRVGPHRQVGFGKLALDDVKDIKNEAGCTVNDVCVAVTGRGLRRYLEAHGDSWDGPLVVSQPISVRPKGDTSVDNQVAGMTLSMHDDLDPAAQLAAINRESKGAKEEIGAVSAALLTNWSKFAAPALATQAFRFYSAAGLAERHPPIANLTLSNVPGPPFPLYLGGSKMMSMYPLGPAIHGQRLNVTLVSYVDTIFVGVVGDRDTLPDVSSLCDHLRDALDEMTQAILDRPATTV